MILARRVLLVARMGARSVTAIGIALAGFGCSHARNQPRVIADLTVSDRHQSNDQAGLVQVTAGLSPDEQPSSLHVLSVRFRNASERDVQIRYDSLSLLESQGNVLPVLPPRPASVPPSKQYAIDEPQFRHSRFAAAPYLASSYPSLPVWNGPFSHDHRAEDAAYARWPPGLPTRTLRSWAIPAGVLSPGGEIDGRLYFPRAVLVTPRVLLQIRLYSTHEAEVVARHDIMLDLVR